MAKMLAKTHFRRNDHFRVMTLLQRETQRVKMCESAREVTTFLNLGNSDSASPINNDIGDKMRPKYTRVVFDANDVARSAVSRRDRVSILRRGL